MGKVKRSSRTKRRRINPEPLDNISVADSGISENITSSRTRKESETSIDYDADFNNDNVNEIRDKSGEIGDNDDSRANSHNHHNDNNGNNISTHESVSPDDEMSVDQILDANKDEEIDDKQKLLVATEKLACLDGKYFEVDIDKSSLIGKVIASCKLCNPQKRIQGSLRTTSNFTTHLKRCHQNNYTEYQKYSEEKKKRYGTKKIDRKRWSCAFNQESFEANVANFMLRFMIPFRAVEDPAFRKIFDDFEIKKDNCQLQHLTRYILMKQVDKIFKSSFDNVRKEILDVINKGGYLCTTADVWTGGSRRFLGVTVSWIDPESLERKSAAIACRRFYGTHSFEAIADQLSNIHSSFGLTAQSIRATVTDNGSNFIKAFQEFGIAALNDTFADTNEKQPSDTDMAIDVSAYETDFDSVDENIEMSDEFARMCEDKLPRHFRCASHTLNLIATVDSLKAINNFPSKLKDKYRKIMGKCSSLWDSLRSPKTSESLKAYLGISLKRPVITRWNSTYDCIDQILLVQDKLLDTCKVKLANAFRVNDFKFLAEYIRCSKPLACAIDRLQADKSYYGVLLPTLVSLKYEMKKLIDDATVIDFKPLAQAIINGIDKRFQKLFDPSQPDIDAIIAAISHPQFKGRWLTAFTEEEQKKIHDRFLCVVSTEVSSIDSTAAITENEIDGFNFGECSSAIPEFQPSRSQGETAAEVVRYLKSKETGLSLLEKFPTIRKVFLKFNTPLPSSAPAERLFSHVTMMNLPKYNRLTDEHFEQRVLCKVNLAKNYL